MARLAGILMFLISSIGWAVPVFPPMDTPTFIAKSTDLLVARCINANVRGRNGGLMVIEVEVLTVLKGNQKVGNATLATTGQRMEKGRRYLLASFGGTASNIQFVAQSDQAVVELPTEFDLQSLDGIGLREKIQRIFDARRSQVERLIEQLKREKAILDQTAPHPRATTP